MNIKHKWLWTAITALLGALTVFLVVRSSGMSVGQITEVLAGANPGWMILAVISTVGMIYFEGRAVLTIIGGVGYKRKRRQGFVYAAADAYFSAITPSATGGQPASAYFMILDKVPGAVATAGLLVNLIMYNAAILTIGIVCVLVHPDLFFHFQPVCKLLIVAGFLVLIGMAFLFIMLLRHPGPLYRLCVLVTDFMHRHHLLRHPEKLQKKLADAEKEFGECVEIMSGKWKMWVGAYFYNLMQRVAQFFVTVFAFLAIGGKGQSLKLWMTQCYISLGANCVPIPGSMGVTDYLMLDGYMNLMDQSTAYTLQLLARGLAFYCSVALSGVVVVIAYLAHVGAEKRKHKK